MDISFNEHWYSFINADDLRALIGEKGKKTLLCLSVNPSKARPEYLDPTLKRIRDIALANGFDGWIMFNLHPCGGKHPDGLPEETDAWTMREHGEALKQAVQEAHIDTVWCAWGKLVEMRPYIKTACCEWVKMLSDCAFTCTTTTLDGHPAFPLYQPKDSPLIPFDIHEYIAKLTERPHTFED